MSVADNNETLYTWLHYYGACTEALRWVRRTGLGLNGCWAICNRGDWMLWLLDQCVEAPRSALQLAAVEIAEHGARHLPTDAATQQTVERVLHVATHWAAGIVSSETTGYPVQQARKEVDALYWTLARRHDELPERNQVGRWRFSAQLAFAEALECVVNVPDFSDKREIKRLSRVVECYDSGLRMKLRERIARKHARVASTHVSPTVRQSEGVSYAAHYYVARALQVHTAHCTINELNPRMRRSR